MSASNLLWAQTGEKEQAQHICMLGILCGNSQIYLIPTEPSNQHSGLELQLYSPKLNAVEEKWEMVS